MENARATDPLPSTRPGLAVSAATRPGAQRVDALRVEAGRPAPRLETVAEEEPIALVYNGLSYAVMMATPNDLEDFALGFSLTEGILSSPSELYDIAVERLPRGAEVRLTVAASRFADLRARQRNLAGRTGCGLCGVDTIAEALRPVTHVASPMRFEAAAITAAMAAFPALQALNREVGAVHAAGLARADGAILAVREDVGRHNALDKLAGHVAREGLPAGQGFVVVTSRCSYEMVHKTAAAGVPLIASVSAPTALAIAFAEEAGVTLCAFARDDRFTVYAGRERIDL
jgi:FdhD protein